ncbi:polysaccharide deacetylase family protein [Halomarina salina]|uniref:Polysaccharide deacetylase family protein n=1 Tax=Halomarina salina TaxID=1872699 RepID=A0ABD5RJ19_9EURY|nr:polysaccharide deacetylase family protein [Halomarina salina]
MTSDRATTVDDDGTPTAVLSVDFELFSQTPAYRSAGGTAPADEATAGLEMGQFLRETLADHDAEATFFTVSSVAEDHPDEVRAIADAGHEIASHTHSHRLLSDLDPDERREELVHSRDVLESVTGATVEGFRAPAFDVPEGTLAALADAGYRYDSSVAACRKIPGWYGGEDDAVRPCSAVDVQADAPDTLAELPIAVMPGLRLPLTGTWLRFFGVRYTIAGMHMLARRGITPVLYVHPWELADLPDVEGVPKRVYVRTGAWMRRAVERILAEPFEFVTARSVVADAAGTPPLDAPAPGAGGAE